jgi:preprotein translocase subunit SecG
MVTSLISCLSKVPITTSVLYITFFLIIVITLGIIVNKQEKNK